MNRFLLKSSAFVCAAFSLSNVNADTVDGLYELEEFLVSFGPSIRPVADFAHPVSILSGEEVRQSVGATLGAMLDFQPGVSASSFTGGASRPLLRGFDGPRVKILDSGVEATDVSATSPDHGVAIEPLLVERVEIIRGPATLLYGSSAIGGAVNVVGREIPREPLPDGDYAEGAAEFRVDSVSSGTTFLGYSKVGTQNWAFSVTALERDHEDYETPEGSQFGTFVQTQQLSAGGSWFFNNGSSIGASFSSYESLYGLPEEDEEVSIDLNRDRFDAEFALVEPFDWIEAVRLRFGYTDYEHSELEGDEVGTVFERDGWDLRLEVAHRDFAFIEKGIVGVQASDTDLVAIGDEAFVPGSNTENQAIFITEHIEKGALHFELGGRLERQEVKADGGVPEYDDSAFSLAASALFEFSESNSIALSLQRSERHPTSTELYADGRHLATQQFELGDSDLGVETAYSADLTFRHDGKHWDLTLSGFYTDFSDFIYLGNTGLFNVEAGEPDFETYEFTSEDAVFWGVEGELEYTTFLNGDVLLSIALMADYVNAELSATDESLPRIPPMRVGARVSLAWDNWDLGLKVKHAFAQHETADQESDTDSYTDVSFNVERSLHVAEDHNLIAFLQMKNLLDDNIRDHTSFLKDELLLPGRNVIIGARFEF